VEIEQLWFLKDLGQIDGLLDDFGAVAGGCRDVERFAGGQPLSSGSKQFRELSQGGHRLRESLPFEGCKEFLDRSRNGAG